ncbi:hypothetical protein D3C87_1662260 [compost metagenome]
MAAPARAFASAGLGTHSSIATAIAKASRPRIEKDPRQPNEFRLYTATSGPAVIARPADESNIDWAKVRFSRGKLETTALAQEHG